MSKLPVITGKDLIKALQKDGFEICRQRGSHVQLRKFIGGEKLTFPVPVHPGKDLTRIIHRQLKNAKNFAFLN